MPNRVLRDWTNSDKINAISVHAERFFTRLIMKVDDYGCFYADERLLKANLFPLQLDEVRQADISRWMAECQKAGLIVLYKVAQKKYLQILDFRQRLDRAKSKFPEPPNKTYSIPNANESVAIVTGFPPETERETERKPNQKPETEARSAHARLSLGDFELMFDEIWKEQMRMIHPGKDVPQAIRETYAHLEAGGRLQTGELSDFKRTVNSFLSNKRAEQKKPSKVLHDLQ